MPGSAETSEKFALELTKSVRWRSRPI